MGPERVCADDSRSLQSSCPSLVGPGHLRTERDWCRGGRIVTNKDTRLLNRREFNGLCVALSSFVTSSGASALDAASPGAGRTVKFRDGTVIPALGQGSAGLGKGRHPAAEEEEALRTGLSLGMTLIDTSGDYGEGRSEELIKRVIAGQRDRAFVVSKVEANDVARRAMARAREESLSRLGTHYLDLYLLHWPVSNAHFPEMVAGFERLRAASKFVPGACPTSQSAKWKSYSVFHKGIAARPIRSSIASVTAPLNMTYCHGASSMVCQ